jgi:hypothetical protein
VRIGHEAALRLDRSLRARARHELAYRPELWLPLQKSSFMQRSAGPMNPFPLRAGLLELLLVSPHRLGQLLLPRGKS